MLVLEVHMKEGKGYVHTETVHAIMPDHVNKGGSILYTDCFPEGVCVKDRSEVLGPLWLVCLEDEAGAFDEDEEDEEEE